MLIVILSPYETPPFYGPFLWPTSPTSIVRNGIRGTAPGLFPSPGPQEPIIV